MVSCGKDNRILCWNPNSSNPEGEILSEIASTVQWYSDVQWCPRNPALIASSSLDGNVTVYSVFGGSQQQVQTTNKIADSFPGMDNFSASAHVSGPQATHIVYNDLIKPPKFLGRRAGVSFGFGGKLVSFDGLNPQQVRISQVVTEPGLVESSRKLEAVMSGQGDFIEYCRMRADEMKDQESRFLWYFLKANFEGDSRGEFLNLLGYQVGDIQEKLNKFIKPKKAAVNGQVDEVVDQLSNTGLVDNDSMFDAIAKDQKEKEINGFSPEKVSKFSIPSHSDDMEGLISQSLLVGNIEAAVELCMSAGRTTEAIIIAITGQDSSLLSRTQLRYFEENTSKNPLLNLISALVTRDCTGIATQSELTSWKEALVAILVHSSTPEEVSNQATVLGERLEGEKTLQSVQNAILCFICAGNLDKVVDSWDVIKKLRVATTGQAKAGGNSDEIVDMQELIEIVMIMKCALQGKSGGVAAVGLPQRVEQLLVNYGMLLANQGAFESALKYVTGAEENNEKVAELSQRLYYSLGLGQHQGQGQMKMGQGQGIQKPNPYLNNNNINNNVPQMGGGYGQPQQQQRPSIGTLSYTGPVPQSQFMTPAPIPASIPAPPLPGMPQQQFTPQPPTQGYFAPPTGTVPAVDPPRPPSAGLGGAGVTGGGLSARNKYPRDPSVQAAAGAGYGGGQNYFTPSFNATPVPQAAPMAMQTQSQQQIGGGGGFMATNAPVPGQFNTTPMNSGFGGGATLDPMANAGGMLQQPPMPPMGKNPTPPPGWNDPPAFNTNRAPKAQVSQRDWVGG